MWLALRDDLIVVAQAEEAPGNVVHYAPSVLRVAKASASHVPTWRHRYAQLLNVDIQASRYLETDLRDASLTFHPSFFAPRSLAGWARLSRHFARMCHSFLELSRRSGLKQDQISHSDRETHLVYATLRDAPGDER